MKSIFKRVTVSIITLVFVLVAVFGITTFGATSAAASETTYAQPYPWSKVTGGTTGDYIADSYNNVSSGHIFESVTQERLLDVLSSTGNYYIIFGGPEHQTSQAVLSTINARAKANGITKIYHFDPFVDGYQMDITKSDTAFTTSNGTSINQLWTRITSLLPTGEPISSYNSNDTLLFLYNREASTPIKAYYSIKDAAGYNSDNETVKIDKVFKGGDSANPIIPNSVRSDFAFFKRSFNGFATYFNYNNGNGPDAQGNRTGAVSTELFTSADEEGFVFHQVNFAELLNLFNSPGEHTVLFGASWCHNTQAIIGDVARKAKQYNHKTVYVYDTTLGNQLAFGTGADIDKVTASSSVFNTRNSVNTGNDRGNISYVYGELVKYLGGFITENNSNKNNSITYYPNGDLNGTLTATLPWDSGSNLNAIRLQLPFLISYNKDTEKPVTKQWLHKNAANNGTYTEYMLELAWVLKTANAKAAPGSVDGLSKVDFAAEAVAALDNVLKTDSAPGQFTSAATPVITGTVKAGNTLTVKTGNWNPAPSFSYQWYANGQAIQGATGSTYKITTSNLGKKIKVKVTGSLSGYVSETKTSAETAKVAADFKSAPVPKIIGTAGVGKLLKSKAGNWSPKPNLSYQWYANNKKIKGANKANYKIAKSLKGKKIMLTVTAKKTNYVTTIKTSKATKKVK